VQHEQHGVRAVFAADGNPLFGAAETDKVLLDDAVGSANDHARTHAPLQQAPRGDAAVSVATRVTTPARNG
jgi:hypothetical protein